MTVLTMAQGLLSRLTSRVLLLSLLFVAIFSLSAVPPLDPDLWWHLANGRLMLALGGWPHFDVFSFTAAGHPWVVHEWLADLGMFFAYRAGGLPLLVAIFALVVVAGAICLHALLRGSGLHPTAAVVLTMVGALAGSTAWGARPQLLNLLFTGLLVCYLQRYSEGRLSAWYLPPFLWLWANLHSGFLVGLIISLLFLAGEVFDSLRRARTVDRRHKELGVAIVAGLALSLVNPYGIDTLLFPLGTLTSPLIQTNIQEWASPDFHSMAGLLFEALLFILLLGLATRRVRAKSSDFLLAAALLYLALSSQRHVPLFVIASAPLTGRCAKALLEMAGSFLPALPQRQAAVAALRANPIAAGPTNRVLLGALNLVLLAVVAAGMIADRAVPNLQPSAETAALSAGEPVQAVESLLAVHRPLRLFNYYDFGGYALWRLYPVGGRVFIDGRVEVYGPQVFSQYLAVNYLSSAWPEVLARYRPDAIMMPTNHPLVTLLAADPDWKLLEKDRVATVFTRVGSTP
ncbi:MAG TPA: hypothetical protein VLS53_01735 [Candidatus Dormibacteraeota bacterium]|nr:hypothetical protein [Candidatus Dormibacteraeota bacterium]